MAQNQFDGEPFTVPTFPSRLFYKSFTRTYPVPKQRTRGASARHAALSDLPHRLGDPFSSSTTADGEHGLTETFCIGDVIIIDTGINPWYGVIVELYGFREEAGSDANERWAVIRFLIPPDELSFMTKQRRQWVENEVFYSHDHKVSHISTRRSRNSAKAGVVNNPRSLNFDTPEKQSAKHSGSPATVDSNSAAAPAAASPLADETDERMPSQTNSPVYENVPISDILSKCTVFPTAEAFEAAVSERDLGRKGKAKRVALGKGSARRRQATFAGRTIRHQGKHFPIDLVCNRAVDDQKGLWFVFDWEKALKRGIEGGRWDLKDAVESEKPDVVGVVARSPQKGRNTSTVEPETPSKRRKTVQISLESLSESDLDEHASSSSSEDEESEDEFAAAPVDDGLASENDIPDEAEMEGSVDDGVGPRTPSKRKRGRNKLPGTRKRSALSSPVKARPTPRSRRALKARKRFSLQRATNTVTFPMRRLLLSTSLTKLSLHDRAKALLHVGATPETLPCREDEYEEVMAHLEDAVEMGEGGCIYISGVPGTGKTATVREVVRALHEKAERQEINPFNFVEINGMKVSDPAQAYSLLWESLSGGDRVTPKHALGLLEKHFERRGPGRHACVVLMDELDQLVTAKQDVMYNFFNWPNLAHSRLVVVAVANTMDLPERVLNQKVASRLGMVRIPFQPYTDSQLASIVQSRLRAAVSFGSAGISSTVMSKMTDEEMDKKVAGTLFDPVAVTYVAKRVSNVSGDARKALDVCRRAVELVSAGADGAAPASRKVTIKDATRVFAEMVKSTKVAHLTKLGIHQKVLLLAIMRAMRKEGTGEGVRWGEVVSVHLSLSRLHALTPLPTPCDLSRVLASLTALRAVLAEPGRAGDGARVSLYGVSEEDVGLALEADERGKKML